MTRLQDIHLTPRKGKRRPLSPATKAFVERDIPKCPRCDTTANGRPGGWWCGECSAPVVQR